MHGGALKQAHLALAGVRVDDPRGRFAFRDLRGDGRFSATPPVSSELAWSDGTLYGLEFGAARLPFTSRDGVLALEQDVRVETLGGEARIEQLRLRPPGPDGELDITFGLALDSLDVGQLAQALGHWTGASKVCAWSTGSRSRSTPRCTPTASAACASAFPSARCRTCRASAIPASPARCRRN